MGQLGSAEATFDLPAGFLMFAREPDSDLDLELEEDGTAQKQPSGRHSPAPQKPPRRTTLLLGLLLLVVAGGAYFAIDPNAIMQLLSQPQPGPHEVPAKHPLTATRSSLPSVSHDSEPSNLIPAPGTIPTPLFEEGQKVSVIPNTASPLSPVSLGNDAAGTKPGPTVSAASTLLVLDAELHAHTWVYLLRTEDGATGWLTEKQLAAKP